jgi:hypothetical protein
MPTAGQAAKGTDGKTVGGTKTDGGTGGGTKTDGR